MRITVTIGMLILSLTFWVSFIKPHTSYIFAPWRSSLNAGKNIKKTSCAFCKEIAGGEDEKHLILFRTKRIIIQLNPYPYTIGSLLIYPTKHIASPHKVNPVVWENMWTVARICMAILNEHFHTEKFSIGMNVHAGSIPGHLHLHVIPRLGNQDGFMEAACETRIINDDLQLTYRKLKEYFL